MLALRQYVTWALVLTVSLSFGAFAFAQEADADTAKATLDKGIQLFEDLDFVGAKAALLDVDRDKLDEDDQELLDEYLVKVDPAIRAQMADQEAFDNAEKALKDENWSEARQGYAQAADSEFLPEPMRKDARAQLALVDERAKAAAAADEDATDEDDDDLFDDEDDAVAADEDAMDDEAFADDDELAVADDDAVVEETPVPAPRTTDPVVVAPSTETTETVSASASNILTRAEERRLVRLQQVQVAFTKSMTQAKDFLATAENAAAFNSARDAVRAATNEIESNRTVIPTDQYRGFRGQIDILTEDINAREVAWERARVKEQTEEIDARNREASKARSEARQIDIDNRIQAAKMMIKQYDFEGAYQTVEGILRIDPRNSWALNNRDLLQTFYFLKKEKNANDALLREEHANFVALREAEIPWDAVLRYPDSWMDLTASRKRFRPEVANDSMENIATRQLLERKINSVDFQEQPLENVVKWLRDVMSADITVNWSELESAGIGKETTVTLHLRDKKFDTVLKQLLTVAGGPTDLGYVVNDGVIEISTREGLAKNTTIRTYDIRDLLVRVPNFVGPDMNLNTGGDTSSNGSGSSGISDPWANSDGSDSDEGNVPTKDEMTQQIMEMIATSVDPDSWREPWGAGTIGSLTVLPSQGQLIITQTQENHDEIAKLLDSLRESWTMEINIEARFISVSSSFLESIGLNLDMYFNLGGNSQLIDPRTGASAGVTPPYYWAGEPGSRTMPPMGVIQNNTFADMVGRGVGTIGGELTGPSLSIGGAFLDDIQVNFLIQATQANSHTRTLVAPRLTIFNGQRAYVAVMTQQAYIANYTPTVSENVGVLTPEIGYIPIGSVLDVEGTISADRRYVTMTVRPTVTRLVSLTGFPIQTSTGSTTSQAFIQLPVVAVQEMATTVSVPDRGTLLLGGQRQAAQFEREQGVPLLSKIPVVNRLFTNRGMVRDEQTLLILVKPTIIINRESEEEAFPGLANMP